MDMVRRLEMFLALSSPPGHTNRRIHSTVEMPPNHPMRDFVPSDARMIAKLDHGKGGASARQNHVSQRLEQESEEW